MKNDIAIFLPTRAGSERVKNKNTKPFALFKNGLLELKIKQLLEIKSVKIYLSTNDPQSIKIAREIGHSNNLVIIERPEKLCLSSTPLKALIEYVPEIIKENHILWTHVTSPFVDSQAYQKAIDAYAEMSSENDSLMSVSKIQEFLWSNSKNNFVNFKRELGVWPRTQDIEPLYAVNSAIFLASRETYLKGDRIGTKPLLYGLNKLQSTDVDWNEDFQLAEQLYEINRK